MKKLLILAVFFALFVSLFGQTITVTFIEDSLTKKNGNSYSALYIGDTLTANSVVKIGGSTLAVLNVGTAEIRLKGPGEWKVGDFINKSKSLNSMGYSSFFDAKMGKLMGQGQDTQSTTIMGVRGFPDTPEGIAASEYYDTGMEYLRSGKYQAALDMFTECLGYVRLEQLNELYLQIALAQAGLGQKNSALMTLEASALTPESGSYAEYAVFRAGLLLELLDFSSVLSFIQRVDTSAFGDEDKASIILLEAFAYNGLGRSAEYKTAVAKLSKKPYLNTEAGLLASGLKQ